MIGFVTRVGWKPTAGGKKADVDVVADGGKTWIDVKDTEPFTTESTRWTGHGKKEGLRDQAKRLVDLAQHVNEKPQVVIYEFTKGVTASVARALQRVGRDAGIPVEVRGMVLEDAKLVVPPGRDPHREESDP